MSPSPKLFTKTFGLLVATQSTFGFAWSIFLLTPKFMTEELAASPQEVGAVGALGNLAAVAVVPLLGRCIDRVGRKPMVTVGAVLCALQSLGYLGLTSVDWRLYALQMLLQVGFVVTFNAAGAAVADHAPPDRLGQALGLFGAANIVMNSLAAAATEAVVPRWGWSAAFLLAFAVGTASVVLSRWLPDDPPVTRSASTPPRFDAALVRTMLASLTMGAAYVSVMTFFQPFMLAQGVREVSPFFFGFTIAAVAVRLGLGRVPDRLGRERVATVMLAVYGAVAAGVSTMRQATLPVFGALMGAAHGMLHPALAALAVQGRPSERRGAALAYVNGSFMFGSAIAAYALGRVAEDVGYDWVFWSGGAGTLVGVILLAAPWLAVGRPRGRAVDSRA